MRFRFILLVALLGMAGSASGHSDSPVGLSSTGRAEGLPAEFQPLSVFLDLEPLRMCTIERPSLAVFAPNGQFVLPLCLAPLLDLTAPEWVSVGASWYHDPDLLPYYLALDFRYGPDRMEDGAFHVVLDLRTAELMKLIVTLPVPCDEASSYAQCARRTAIDPMKLCEVDELQASSVPASYYMSSERPSFSSNLLFDWE